MDFDPSGKPEDLFKTFMSIHKDESMLPADVPRDDSNNIDKKKIK